MREDVHHTASLGQRATPVRPCRRLSRLGSPVSGRFRRAAVAAATALILTIQVARSARAEARDGAISETRDGAAASTQEPFRVTTTAFANGGTLIVSPSNDAASTAVCLAPVRLPGEVDQRLDVVEHGGVESYSETDGVGVWCVALPPAELAYGLWLSARMRALGGASDGTPATSPLWNEPGLSRAVAIALEGAVDETLRGPAFTVVVAGRADAPVVEELAQQHFGPRAPQSAARAAPWQPVQTTERMSAMHGSVGLPTARYAWVTPRGSDDETGIRIAFEVLGGGERARLPRRLIGANMAKQVASWTYHLSGGTLSGLLVVPSSRVSIDRIRRFVDGALKQLRLVGPSRGELIRAKQRLLLDAYRTWEDLVARARLLASYELLRGGAERAPRDIAAIERATNDTVRQAVLLGLRDARRTTIEIFPLNWPEDDPRRAKQRLYTVAPGDTLAAIAARFRVDVSAIARTNDLDPKYALSPGQPLWIP